MILTTRVENLNGPYLDLFARASHYSNFGLNYRNTGFEVGYQGPLTSRVRGLFSYRSTAVSGITPFRFDLVEIARELRTTFDVEVTPRYLVPIDVRYDLDLRQVRDSTVGVLRSYKTFAYGVVYQSAHPRPAPRSAERVLILFTTKAQRTRRRHKENKKERLQGGFETPLGSDLAITLIHQDSNFLNIFLLH